MSNRFIIETLDSYHLVEDNKIILTENKANVCLSFENHDQYAGKSEGEIKKIKKDQHKLHDEILRGVIEDDNAWVHPREKKAMKEMAIKERSEDHENLTHPSAEKSGQAYRNLWKFHRDLLRKPE